MKNSDFIDKLIAVLDKLSADKLEEIQSRTLKQAKESGCTQDFVRLMGDLFTTVIKAKRQQEKDIRIEMELAEIIADQISEEVSANE